MAIGALMNARGLMELIILNIGLDFGVITPTLFSMMVIMAIATTLMASPLFELFYGKQRDALVALADRKAAALAGERVTALLRLDAPLAAAAGDLPWIHAPDQTQPFAPLPPFGAAPGSVRVPPSTL